ncbi:MAG: N-acetylmuramoyl-L-alanine amidase [Catenibacterium mitsuokai]|nr:N-acetylmuramoyl-L-alanine amidase [Catenibacterium mitsuokai]MDD6594599.1 N-acetylmuramoyl-L-alanine amidase [Catenibacterium mitsuokai]
MEKKIGRKFVFILVALICGFGMMLLQMNNFYVHAEDATSNVPPEIANQVNANASVVQVENNKTAADEQIIVCLDPGHGGHDSGATYRGYQEKDINLRIALYARDALQRAGYKVVMTRDSDVYLGLEQRVKIASENDANVIISIHCNSGDSNHSVHGAEVEIPNGNMVAEIHDQGKNLGDDILDKIDNLGVKNNGSKERNSKVTKYNDGSTADYYSIVRNAKQNGIPGIIIEHAFISNDSDLERYLANDTGRKNLGEADAAGVIKYFNSTAGINYHLVYDYDYYIAHNPDVKKAFSGDKGKTLLHFWQYGMNEGRRAISTFDVQYYKNNNADLQRTFGNNLRKYYMHYMQYGYKERRGSYAVNDSEVAKISTIHGINYSAVYDHDYYYNHNDDLRRVYAYNDGIGLLNHFITYGMNEGRQGHADFNVNVYKDNYTDLSRAYGNRLKDYYMHYIKYGAKEGRNAKTRINTRPVAPGNTTSTIVTKYNGVDYSLVYDANYYRNKYTDLQKAFSASDYNGLLNHFVTYGMNEGRQANATFDVNSYRLQYGDLRAAYGNNLKSYYLHYIQYGNKEGRKATGTTTMQGAVTEYNGVDYAKVYDFNYYINHNADLKRVYGTYDDIAALRHFVTYGINEGRQASATFDVNSYRRQYADLRKAYGNNVKNYYLHYIQYGSKEGRKAIGTTQMIDYVTKYNGVDYANVYDFNYYINHNEDLRRVYGLFDDYNVLKHFVTYGMDEGRQANENFNTSVYAGNYVDLLDAFGGNKKSYYEHYLKYGYSEGRNAKSLLTGSTPAKLSNIPLSNYRIMGTTNTNVNQLIQFFNKSGHTYPEFYKSTDAPTLEAFARMYFEEANAEGVRAEVAFAQMCLETGYLQYGHDVKIEQFNFAGVGATGNGNEGNSFGKVRLGIRAQIQHLKAYASTAKLRNNCVDPRFTYVKRGSVPYVEQLGGHWAVDPDYGYNVRKLVNRILSI